MQLPVDLFIIVAKEDGIPARWITELEPMKVYENRTASFTCETNHESHAVMWFQHGRKVKNEGRFKVTKEGRVHTLVITEVKRSDEGFMGAHCGEDALTEAELTVQGTFPCHSYTVKYSLVVIFDLQITK